MDHIDQNDPQNIYSSKENDIKTILAFLGFLSANSVLNHSPEETMTLNARLVLEKIKSIIIIILII